MNALQNTLVMIIKEMIAQQGQQTTVFCEISVQEKQKLPRIFYSLRKAKNFWVTVPFMYNFRSLINKFPTIFWSLIFLILLPMLGHFS